MFLKWLDYKFDNATDNKNGILINTTSLVINGNGHTIDASNQARIFLINASQLVINDLTFINANITEGSALLMVNSNVTTNNVVFKNSVANNGVISASGTKYLSNNDVFKDVTSTKMVLSNCTGPQELLIMLLLLALRI